MSEGTIAPGTAAPAAEAQVVEQVGSEQTEVNEGQELQSQDTGSEESGQEAQAVNSQETAKAEADKAAKKLGAEKEGKGKYSIKVDGEALELTEQELIRYAQLGKAGQKRMQEHAELKKEVAELVEALKTNPKKILSDKALGVDLVKFAQEILAEQLEEEAKSPEQREIEKLRKQIEEREKSDKDREESEKSRRYQEMVDNYHEEFDTKITSALEQHKLPRSPAVLVKIGTIMETAIDRGLNIDPGEAVKMAKELMQSDNKAFLADLDDDSLEAMLGDDIVKRLRKSSLKRVKTALPNLKTESTGENSKPKVEPRKQMDMKDFMRLTYEERKKLTNK